MCGIFGLIGNVPKEQQTNAFSFLDSLFHVSVSRGKDASGFAAIHKGKGWGLIVDKRPLPSPKFTKRSEQFRALRRNMPSIFIGHTRQTTNGDPKKNRNNHPFNSSRYSMVHNGAITDYEDLKKQKNIKTRIETDSALLLNILDENNDAIDGFKDILSSTKESSAMAIALLEHKDTSDPRLFLFRNPYRPLYILTSDVMNCMFFASTEEIIKMALKRSFGANLATDDILAKFEMDITEYPEYKFCELGLNRINNFYIVREETLEKPKEKTYLPVKTNYYSSHNLSSSTVPTAVLDGPVSELRKEALASAKICKLLQTSPYMTDEEVSHWRKWMFEV